MLNPFLSRQFLNMACVCFCFFQKLRLKVTVSKQASNICFVKKSEKEHFFQKSNDKKGSKFLKQKRQSLHQGEQFMEMMCSSSPWFFWASETPDRALPNSWEHFRCAALHCKLPSFGFVVLNFRFLSHGIERKQRRQMWAAVWPPERRWRKGSREDQYKNWDLREQKVVFRELSFLMPHLNSLHFLHAFQNEKLVSECCC